MAIHDFVVDLMGEMLKDKELALTEQDIRFYDKGTTAVMDETLDSHIRWKNARCFNEDSNVIRSSLLIVQLPFEDGTTYYANFHVGELYRIYRKDGMKKVLPTIKSDIRDVKAVATQNLALLNQFQSFESIKEHLIIRPLNYDDNEKALKDGIYRRVGDMALTLYISLGSEKICGSSKILSAMVRKDMFQLWGMSEEDTLDWAFQNTMRLQQPVFWYISGVYERTIKARYERFMDDESVQIDFNDAFAPSLSTEQEVNGAVAAFYPGVLERLYRMVGGDFYLVFTSIYDVHIHPVNGKVKVNSMRNRLAEMNRDVNRRSERLSRQIYKYDGEKKEITVV